MKPFFVAQVLPVDSTASERASSFVDGLTAPITTRTFDWEQIAHDWLMGATNFGIRVVLAIVLFFLGRYLIRLLTSFLRRILERRQVEGVAITLFNSLFIALLYIILGICIAVMLGVKSVSFAAVLASMGLAIGMALSGQLQNLAGGVIIMVTKPFKIGDAIVAQGESGIVRAVSLFHTHLRTFDNQAIYIPNGILSSGVITNISEANVRRVEWIISIDYDSDYQAAHDLLREIIIRDERIQASPEPIIALHALGQSSLDIIVRAWVESDNYWTVFWEVNEQVLREFRQHHISFPFPQLTISKRD